jgi:hypothetical protein
MNIRSFFYAALIMPLVSDQISGVVTVHLDSIEPEHESTSVKGLLIEQQSSPHRLLMYAIRLSTCPSGIVIAIGFICIP